MTHKIAIKIENLQKTYNIYDNPQDRLKQSLFRGRRKYYRTFDALKNVTLDIKKGETLGIVGCNGSGKSTLLQIICGIITPSSGSVAVDGRISALLELGAGFNPEFTGKENIFLNGAVLGLSSDDIKEKYDNIVEFSGLADDFIQQPVKTYSSGMYVRLAFAIAVASDPDILVVDEALSVGDEAFQRKCFVRIRDIQERGGTILFVSHAAKTVMEICDRAILMEKGEMISLGLPNVVVPNYQKLIFAPEEKRQNLILRMKRGENIADSKKKEKIEKKNEKSDDFDLSMIPESSIHYEQNGAEITNPHITDVNGENVNVLTRGNSYIYNYTVSFSEDVKSVRFGMLIKTKSGVSLGGASALLEKYNNIISVKSGMKVNVSFKFTASLLEGTYFLNCGCKGIIGDELTFLHRIHDAAMIRVLPENGICQSGTIDFSPEPTITVA